jgi:transposase
MRAYSIDIRGRVIENLDQESMRKTAKRFRVSEYFVYRLKKRAHWLPSRMEGGRARLWMRGVGNSSVECLPRRRI